MKLKLIVEFEPVDVCYDPNNEEEKSWFFGILRGSDLVLHENAEIGDDIGTVRVLEITEP